MDIRFFAISEGDAHIHAHGVEDHEVAEAFRNLLEDGAGREGAKVAIGRTDAGRYLRVV